MISEKESNSFDEQNSKTQQHTTEHEMKDIDEISKFVLEDAGESDRMKAARAKNDERIVSINKRKEAEEHALHEIWETIEDLDRRAEAIAIRCPPNFKHVKSSANAHQVTATDENILISMKALFGGKTKYSKNRPYMDTFKAKYIGWKGQPMDVNDFDSSEVASAIDTLGIKALPFEKVSKILRIFARQVERNSLTERVKEKIPTWDGVSRLETEIITRMHTLDTPLNRRFSRYFWLSIYCRVMYPGCLAPMVLAFIGGMGGGKSRMANEISKEIIGDENAKAVPLHWSKDENSFLRAITGHSIVANGAEMAGFSVADLGRIKNFITTETDYMDMKFMNPQQQPRQWIIMMDSNKYDGLQRDEDGNRRIYPMFTGQLDFDDSGKPRWDPDFIADFAGFRETIWQIMAECRAWIDKNGLDGYNDYVIEVTDDVKKFSMEEMKKGNGVIRDDDMDDYIMPAIKSCRNKFIVKKKDEKLGRPSEKFGIFVAASDIKNALKDASRNSIRVISTHVNSKMTSLGAKKEKLNNVHCFMWYGIFSFDELMKKLKFDAFDSEEYEKVDGWYEGGKFNSYSDKGGGF